jgi:large subunit ribosomal protein L14e
MEVAVNSVAMSLAGHDRGEIFAVIGLTDDHCALLADGKRRKTEKPKKKKLKHLRAIGSLDLPVANEASNREIRGALRAFGEAFATVAEGGS